MKWIWTGLIGMAATAWAGGANAECNVIKAKYDALQMGMSIAAAERVLDCKGEELSSSEFGGIKTIMLMWQGNSFGGNMNAMFQDNRLINKAQFGLK